MRVTFFRVAERKSPKKGRPYCARPFAALRATCGARTGGAPQNSLRATRSVQTTAASQCTKCVCPSAHARPPAMRFSALAEGNPKTDIHTGHCFAALRSAPSRGRKRHALRTLGRAQRWPVWLFGCWMFGSPPLLAAPAAGRLRGGMGVEAPMLRELTRRSCLNGARQRGVSSAAHPATAPPQVCPFAPRRGRRLGVAFLLGTFLWRSKEQVPRPPGRDPASALKPSAPSKPALPGFDRLGSNSRRQTR